MNRRQASQRLHKVLRQLLKLALRDGAISFPKEFDQRELASIDANYTVEITSLSEAKIRVNLVHKPSPKDHQQVKINPKLIDRKRASVA